MKRSYALLISAVCAFVIVGCLSTADTRSKAVSAVSAANGNTSTSTTTSSSTIDFLNANSVKTILNKQNFYNNSSPNSTGCAGDSKNYFDPITDRMVPTKPKWLKNISVELTNSNAQGGPSNATGCALSGVGSAQAANCAAFDDLQPLTNVGRGVVIGGYGCTGGATNCSDPEALSDVWSANFTDVSTSTGFVEQADVLPEKVGVNTSQSVTGVGWGAGDFDELHNEFYIFGGATPTTADKKGVKSFTNHVSKLKFLEDGTLSTAPGPVNFGAAPSDIRFFAGWETMNPAYISVDGPSRLAGATFTYSVRRDPSLKNQCTQGSNSADASGSCSSDVLTGSLNAISVNEHSDYFLLVGGMPNGGGNFSKKIYAFNPHNFSNDLVSSMDVGTTGRWNMLSNDDSSGSLSTMIMKVVDYSTSTTSTTEPIKITNEESTITSGTLFCGWKGHAYHRTVFDPTMNRYYIFGGLVQQPSTAVSSFACNIAIGSPSTNAPSLAESEVWVYDPPALGRRPTAGCYSTEAPTGADLPTKLISSTGFLVRRNYGTTRAYTASNFVFPPGGCLQRIKLSTAPEKRFEHSMAFDRKQKAMAVFGGCRETSTIPASGTVQAGDPLLSCTTASSVLRDLWLYVPPKTQDVVPNTYVKTSTPYSSTLGNTNIFGIDHWLDHFPMFAGGNSQASGALNQPSSAELLGSWISLSPTGAKPTARASALFTYNTNNGKYYLQGGFGCNKNGQCGQNLNDLWEFTPPNLATECSVDSGTCSAQGTWKEIKENNVTPDLEQPTQRKGALMASSNSLFSFGDDYYTVTDTPCFGQGPIASGDASISKRNVGAIYIDLDRTEMGSAKNVLVNIKFLPFDQKTKLPGVYDNGTPLVSTDDTDKASTTDVAQIRVELLTNFLKYTDQIQSLVQPRYHEFMNGTPVTAHEFSITAGATGQVTEKQILVPLNLDSTVNLIKIERIQGSAKFYEVTVSKF